MDPDPFVRWALDDARTLEERFTTELLVEQLEPRWHWKHQTGYHRDWRDSMEKERERFLNPAYEPAYTETSLRRVAEFMPAITDWSFHRGFQNRPIRDFAALQFLPALEKLTLQGEITDLALLPQFPMLRDLSFGSAACVDYRPLARCGNLRRLTLSFGVHWPEVDGLETLQQLEMLDLSGNLLVFPRGLVFPRVREGRLACAPLSARNVRDLPQFPACEFLHLSGVERLDGIEALPRLRNLTLVGRVADYAPLASLPALTWFRHEGALPLDVTPLSRVPALLFAGFKTKHDFGIDKVPPRDHSPLAESPTLRQVDVEGCPPVELEVAALNAALPSWEDRILLPEPRPVPPLRVIVAPTDMHPRPLASDHAESAELPDKGVLAVEGGWISSYGTAFIAERLGNEAWGHVSGSPVSGHLTLWVECYELMTRFGEVIEAARQLLARLRPELTGSLYIALKVPPREQTAAQKEVDERFSIQADDEYFAQARRDEQARLESLHRYRLKQQQGEPIDPAEFAPEPRARDEEDDDDENLDEDDADEPEGDDESDVAVQKKPDPPTDLDDDEHPLADNYSLMLHFTCSEVWIGHGHAALALHLLDRAADEEFPEAPPQA